MHIHNYKNYCSISSYFSSSIFLLGFLIGAGAFIGLGYVNDKALSVILLTLSVGTNGMVDVGHSVNILDIAPQYGGAIYSIVNMLGSLLGLFGPLVTKTMTQKVRKLISDNTL